MKIGFDAKRVFFNRTGLGNYSRQLLANLAQVSPGDELFLFTPEISAQNPFYDTFEKPPFRLTEISSFKRSLNLSVTWAKTGVEIYHGLSNELPFFIGKKKPRLIVTIHDLLFEDYPEDYPLLDRKIYRQKVKSACEKADLILAVSQATSNDLVHRYEVDEAKIKVHYQSCHSEFFIKKESDAIKNAAEKHGLSRPYMLCVSSLSARKNQLRLLEAYSKSDIARDVDMVFVGAGLLRGQLLDRIEVLNLSSSARLIQVDSLYELSTLYQGAFASVYPSLKEGFGIPILEGFASGVPVVTSNIGSMAEIALDAAHVFNPEDVEDMVRALDGLSDSNRRLGLIQKGSGRIKDFEGLHLARELRQHYSKLTTDV